MWKLLQNRKISSIEELYIKAEGQLCNVVSRMQNYAEGLKRYCKFLWFKGKKNKTMGDNKYME
jgi:hypothetical protein